MIHHRHTGHLRQLIAREASELVAPKNDTNYKEITQFSTHLNGVDQVTNDMFRDVQWWSLFILAMLVLSLRLVTRFKAHIRHLASLGLSEDQMLYWARNRGNWWKIKKHMLYAPLKNKRHNREIQLSKAMNMGTVPSRFHTLLIAAYVLSNIAYCAFLSYHEENHYSVVAELRGRSGTLAVINMIALIIFAGRNNPLIVILQISFDTYNLLHRWTGRVVVVESLIHTMCWYYVKVAGEGWGLAWKAMQTDAFIGWGFVGTAAMVLILLLSLSPLRHAFYETFLNIHILLAVVAVITIYLHCDIDKLPQVPYVQALGFLWLGDRLARFWRIVSANYSNREWTSATVEPMEGKACRVTLHLPKHLEIKPGTHAYLRFGSVNWWESHPFSIAWVEHHAKDSILPITEKDPDYHVRAKDTFTDVSFVIQAQSGLTLRLWETAEKNGPRPWRVKAAFEGPYGGHHSLDSYGHCVLFAGASGITHQLPFVRHLLQGVEDGTVATRKVLLVWIVRDLDQLAWVQPWMDSILKLPTRRDALIIKLYVTRPKKVATIASPSQTVHMFSGRPNIPLILEKEVAEQAGAMCVTVCGPGGLADNVRDAVRDVQEDGMVDFIEESFTW